MKNIIVKIAQTAYKIWKPDFRKTTGWLFISTGLMTLAPAFIHDIIFNLFVLVDLKPTGLEYQDTIGALLIAIGILYHLFYLSDNKDIKRTDTALGILIIGAVTMLIAVTWP